VHKTNYRPTRSQQIALAQMVRDKYTDNEVIVHHVLEDSFTRLYVQVEERWNRYQQLSKVYFKRYEL
jgi:hypothetical protein